MEDLTCYNCERSGHVMEKCPFPMLKEPCKFCFNLNRHADGCEGSSFIRLPQRTWLYYELTGFETGTLQSESPLISLHLSEYQPVPPYADPNFEDFAVPSSDTITLLQLPRNLPINIELYLGDEFLCLKWRRGLLLVNDVFISSAGLFTDTGKLLKSDVKKRTVVLRFSDKFVQMNLYGKDFKLYPGGVLPLYLWNAMENFVPKKDKQAMVVDAVYDALIDSVCEL